MHIGRFAVGLRLSLHSLYAPTTYQSEEIGDRKLLTEPLSRPPYCLWLLLFLYIFRKIYHQNQIGRAKVGTYMVHVGTQNDLHGQEDKIER